MKKLFKGLLVLVLVVFAVGFYTVKAEEVEEVENENKTTEVVEAPKEETKTVATTTESNRKEEVKVEEGKRSEAPKVEEPKVEEPKTEEPKTEEPKTEEPVVEEKVETLKVEDAKVEVEETKVETKKEEAPAAPAAPASEPTKADDGTTVGKITVNIYDSRTGNIAYTTVLYADATKDTVITLADILPGFRYDTKNKVFVKNETLYNYTFVGLFDAAQNGNQIVSGYEYNTTFPDLSKLTCASNATGPTNYKLTLRAKSTLTTEKTISIYAIVNTFVKPNGKVTVNFIDTRSGNVAGNIHSFATDSSISKIKLNALFTNITSSFISEYNGRKYKFLGFYTTASGEGEKLTDDNSLAGNYPEVDTLKTVNSGATANYLIQLATNVEYDGEKTINLYARWELQKQRQKLTINYYDVKVKDDGTREVTKVKSISQNVDPGTTWTQAETLDQIFSEMDTSRPYSGVHDPSSNTETDEDHIYTFKGWYDKAEDGTQITGSYTLTGDYANALQDLSVSGNYVISFTTTTGLDDDYELNVYGYWDSVKAPKLKMKNVNEVSQQGNTSWANANSTASSYTHTYKNPTDGPSTHEFKYWKVYKVNEETEEETEYDGVEYKDGAKFEYDFEGKEPGTIEVLVGRAWWQANVTLILLDGSKELGRGSSFESIKISDVLENDPTKEGYKFLGWVDADGNDVDESTAYTPNEASTNPEAKVVKLYAKWQKMVKFSVSKTWEDGNDENGKRTTTVTVHVKNGDETVETVTLDEESKWTYEFELPEFEDDGETTINYTVEEDEVDGYNTYIDGSVADGFIITNVLYFENVTVTKEWDDFENEDDLRPESITVHLYDKDGEEIQEVTLNDENEWTASFGNLDAYKDGEKLEYTISEDKVEYYELVSITGDAETGFTILNKEIMGQGGTPEEPDTTNNNPNTGDNIISYVIMLMISLSGFASGVAYLKKYKLAMNK